LTSAARLVWINGPFGGGKTSAAKALVARLDDAVLFDPEYLGLVLREMLPVPTGDFQDLPQWRDLWVRTAATLVDHGSRVIVMPMTVLRREYFDEVMNGLRGTGARLDHVVLDTPPSVLRRRIDADHAEPPNARAWRLEKLAQFMEAREWLLPAASLTFDTDELSVDGVAAKVAAQLSV